MGRCGRIVWQVSYGREVWEGKLQGNKGEREANEGQMGEAWRGSADGRMGRRVGRPRGRGVERWRGGGMEGVDGWMGGWVDWWRLWMCGVVGSGGGACVER